MPVDFSWFINARDYLTSRYRCTTDEQLLHEIRFGGYDVYSLLEAYPCWFMEDKSDPLGYRDFLMLDEDPILHTKPSSKTEAYYRPSLGSVTVERHYRLKGAPLEHASLPPLVFDGPRGTHYYVPLEKIYLSPKRGAPEYDRRDRERAEAQREELFELWVFPKVVPARLFAPAALGYELPNDLADLIRWDD